MRKKYDSDFAFRYHRKSTRLKTHNYGWSGTYFVTMCANRDEPIFEIPALRTILQETWESLPKRFMGVTLDEFVIMPDHVHLILSLEGNIEKPTSLGAVMGAYKSLTTVAWLKHIKANGLECQGIIWQGRFHDRRIRDDLELELTRQYIRDNPLKLKLKQVGGDGGLW